MKKAKEYFWSDQVNVKGQGDRSSVYGDLLIHTSREHLDKAIELAYYEGIRAVTGWGLMDIKHWDKEGLLDEKLNSIVKPSI